VRALCDYVPEIKEAKEIFEKAKNDPNVRALIEAREKNLHDYMNDILCAKAEDVEEGIAIGEAKRIKEKREMALGLLQAGIDVNIIAQTSGLSMEEIESLKPQAN
jgi:predicted transposase/invertase (TIGR01784 family)